MRRFFTPALLAIALVAGLAGCTSRQPLTGLTTELTSLQRGADGTLTATVQYDNNSVLAINISSSHHDLKLNGQLIGTVDLSEPLGVPAQHNLAQTGPVKLLVPVPATGEAPYQISSTLHVVTYGDSKELIRVSGTGLVTVK